MLSDLLHSAQSRWLQRHMGLAVMDNLWLKDTLCKSSSVKQAGAHARLSMWGFHTAGVHRDLWKGTGSDGEH
jgi:hypothetical protein